MLIAVGVTTLTIVVTILVTWVVVSGTSFVLGLVCNATDSEVGSLVVDVSFLIEEVTVVLTTLLLSVVITVTMGLVHKCYDWLQC